MAKKFLLLGGGHTVGSRTYRKDETIISDDDLVAIYGKNKFQFVEDVCCSTPEACDHKAVAKVEHEAPKAPEAKKAK